MKFRCTSANCPVGYFIVKGATDEGLDVLEAEKNPYTLGKWRASIGSVDLGFFPRETELGAKFEAAVEACGVAGGCRDGTERAELVIFAPPGGQTTFRHYMPEVLARFVSDVAVEVTRARELFPDPAGLVAAFGEEAGELCKAMLEEPRDRIRAEAVQAAAMACRLALEGDPTLAAVRAKRGADK